MLLRVRRAFYTSNYFLYILWHVNLAREVITLCTLLLISASLKGWVVSSVRYGATLAAVSATTDGS